MEITYHGMSCIRLRGRQTHVIVDPSEDAPSVGGKSVPDIIVRTQGVTDPDVLRPHDGGTQEVAGAGEFEVRGVAIHGLPAGDHTIMLIEVDDVRVVTVGTLARQLTEEEVDTLGHVDVLVIPVGGVDALDSTAASRITRAIEPAVVVPVRFRNDDDLATAGFQPLDVFAKEMGLTGEVVAQAKLATGPIPASEETRVVVLETRPF